MESLYDWPSRRKRFLEAPFLKEREQYLGHLIADGHPQSYTQAIASLLLEVIKCMDMDSFRVVYPAEIETAANRYMEGRWARGYQLPSVESRGRFVKTARQWFSFHHKLCLEISSIKFQSVLDAFAKQQRDRGIAANTIRSRTHRVKQFLVWLADRHEEFGLVSVQDVDEFLDLTAAKTCRATTLKTTCHSLRSFLKHAEKLQLCRPIAQGIITPSTPAYNRDIVGPSWEVVRNLLDQTSRSTTQAGTRAHVILCLCAIYALRAAEVSRLRLDDLDWQNEVLTIRRAKGGRIQRYPLQFEVGEAIIQYLKLGRPMCSSRNLLVSIQAPHLGMQPGMISQVVSLRLRKIPEYSGRTGSHTLRHACATQLLYGGSSLRYISEFLGHRDPKSVSVYAKYDTRTLKHIADFSLSSVL